MLTLSLLILLAVASPMPTDFDRDGDTDQGDFGRLQVELGTTPEPVSVYDLNGDHRVDQEDVAVFMKQERMAK